MALCAMTLAVPEVPVVVLVVVVQVGNPLLGVLEQCQAMDVRPLLRYVNGSLSPEFMPCLQWG